MLWSQYKKELAAHRGENALIVGALFLWYLFLVTRVGKWPVEAVTALSLLPTGFLPLWVLWSALHLYRQEWRENTHYLLLSLPVPAWKITLPKLAALFTGIVGYTALLCGGVLVIMSRTGVLERLLLEAERLSLPLSPLIGTGIKVYVAMVMGFLSLGLTTQVAYAISRLFQRLQGLVIAWAWLLQVWLTGFISDHLGPWLNWLPGISLHGVSVINQEVSIQTSVIDGGHLWATVLVMCGLFALLNVTLLKAVEV